MTPQIVYDTIVSGLISQGRKSRANWHNAYRGEGGRKCAAGFLIPDDFYEPSMEGHMFRYLLTHWPLLQTYLQLDSYTIRLVHQCQTVHDNSPVIEWRGMLREIGQEYGLNTSVCERIYK